MGELMPLQKGVKKEVKPLVSADSTGLSIVVMTSEEDIIGWDRQCIVDVLLRETFIDRSYCSGIEDLLMERADHFWIKYEDTTLVVPMSDVGSFALN